MQRLNLDYGYDGRAKNFSLLFLLLISLVSFVFVTIHYLHTSRENEGLAKLIDKIQGKDIHETVDSSLSQLTPEQQKELIVFSNQVVDKLNMPWADLFQSLSKSSSNEIALLGIEPNSKKGVVKLSGEARNFKAMFDFMRDLSSKSGMAKVYLTEHKVNDQDPDHPIRFTLEASWINKS